MITLDPQTERRIQQELSRGNYTEPSDLINHALDLLNTDEHLTADDRARFDNFLDLRMAEAAKGKLYTAAEAKDILAERRAARLT
jgi:Arc/MetJ-type ribon-helix-helix transcriptional regulator